MASPCARVKQGCSTVLEEVQNPLGGICDLCHLVPTPSNSTLSACCAVRSLKLPL